MAEQQKQMSDAMQENMKKMQEQMSQQMQIQQEAMAASMSAPMPAAGATNKVLTSEIILSHHDVFSLNFLKS